MNEEEFEQLREQMSEQREELHEALAEDLGGEPEDYEVDDPRAERLDESDS